jgi:hypothetical protein
LAGKDRDSMVSDIGDSSSGLGTCGLAWCVCVGGGGGSPNPPRLSTMPFSPPYREFEDITNANFHLDMW